MRYLIGLFFLLALGCTHRTAVSLPLRSADVAIPGSIARDDAEVYIRGFAQGWRQELEAFASDARHEDNLLAYVGKGFYEPEREGLLAGMAQASQLCQRMVSELGREEAQRRVEEELKKTNEAAQPAGSDQRR